jgi:transposase
LDETSFILTHYLVHIWFPKGQKPIKKHAHDHRTRVYVFGALTFREVITEIASSQNSDNFIKFLEKILMKYKKIFIILDNVSYHFTEKVKKFFKDNNIKVIPLPKYSPQYNPIELYWRAIKKWVANKEFYNKNMLLDVLRDAFEKPFLIPTISECQVT